MRASGKTPLPPRRFATVIDGPQIWRFAAVYPGCRTPSPIDRAACTSRFLGAAVTPPKHRPDSPLRPHRTHREMLPPRRVSGVFQSRLSRRHRPRSEWSLECGALEGGKWLLGFLHGIGRHPPPPRLAVKRECFCFGSTRNWWALSARQDPGCHERCPVANHSGTGP